MRPFWTRWRWPIVLVVILVGVLVAAPGALASTVQRLQQTMPMGAQPLDQLSGDAFDQAFLTGMTMHHAMGVMMTQRVVEAGAHRELKDLGGRMIADQSREIEQMRGWLQGWYGQDVTCPMASSGSMMPGGMPGPSGQQPGAGSMHRGGMMPGFGMPMMPAAMPGMMQGGPMGTMPMAGGFWSLPPDQLDAGYMTWMIAHHQGAIDMAMLAQERAGHQEVKDLAASIISTQSAEIATMHGWLNDWYGR